ncbi:MAG: hypothetical protein AABZ47_15460, partial [Planctomycetota bacterium]
GRLVRHAGFGIPAFRYYSPASLRLEQGTLDPPWVEWVFEPWEVKTFLTEITEVVRIHGPPTFAQRV